MVEQIAEQLDLPEIIRRQGFTVSTSDKFRMDGGIKFEFNQPELPEDCEVIFLGHKVSWEYKEGSSHQLLGSYLIYNPAEIQAVLVELDDLEDFVGGAMGFGWSVLETNRADELAVLVRKVGCEADEIFPGQILLH